MSAEVADTHTSNVLALDGAVDVSAARRIREAARSCANSEGDVTVACAGLERLDAAGVQVLLALKKRLEGAGRAMHIDDVPERVFGLLLVTGAGHALVSTTLPAPVEATSAEGES